MGVKTHDFRYIFEYIIVIVIFNFVSRPGRLLFSLVVKGNNNKKKRKTRRGNTREDPRPDKPKARPDRQNRTRQDKTKKRPSQNSFLGVQMLVLGPQKYFWVSIIASFTIVAPVFWVSIIARTLVAPSWVQVGPRLLYWCKGCQGLPKFASSRSMPLRFIRNATPNHFGGPKWGQNKDA